MQDNKDNKIQIEPAYGYANMGIPNIMLHEAICKIEELKKIYDVSPIISKEIEDALTVLKLMVNEYASMKEDYISYKDIKFEYDVIEKALDKTCEELGKPNTIRFVLYGGNGKDYKEYFIKQARKELENGK